MKFAVIFGRWIVGIVNQDLPNGIETTAGYIENGDWKELEQSPSAMCLFDGNYAAYLPFEWPQLKFWDEDMKESFFVTELDFERGMFICSDGKLRNRAQCVVSTICIIDNDWPDNVKNKN